MRSEQARDRLHSLTRATLEATADEPVERDPEPGDVGVVPDEPLPLAGDRVHGAGRPRLLGEPVDERRDLLLVRDRHVRPEELVAPELVERAGERRDLAVPELVAGVDPEVVERGLLHRRREGVGDGVSDQDDALRHPRTSSSCRKKPGYEIEALPGAPTAVSPAAMRPAIANVIASR